jgi:hypothetical protein
MSLCSVNRASRIIQCWINQLLSQFDRQVMCFWMNLLPVCVCVRARVRSCACVIETIFAQMQDKVFAFNLVLQYMRSS